MGWSLGHWRSRATLGRYICEFTLSIIYLKKKLFLLILLTAGAEAVHAQSIAAGTVSLGGSIGYSRSSNNTSYSSNNTVFSRENIDSQFSFSPAAGYFVKDNLAIGVSLGYTANSRRSTSMPAQPNTRPELDPLTTVRVGSFVQYYKMISEQFGVLGTLGLGYQQVKEQEYDTRSGTTVVDLKDSGYYANLTPGIIFFPISKFGISASIGSLGYDRYGFDYPRTPNSSAPSNYESTSSNFGARFGFDQLLFGGTYYFGR